MRTIPTTRSFGRSRVVQVMTPSTTTARSSVF